MEEDYDMVPHNEILKLKKEVEDLKSGTGSEIRKAMHDLTDSINRMNEILKEAAEGMKKEESEELQLDKKTELLLGNLVDILETQNKKIAESMIALTELIKERFPKQATQMPRMPPRAAPPAFIPTGPPKTAPMPTKQMPPPMSQERGLPPFLPKKKGFLSRMK